MRIALAIFASICIAVSAHAAKPTPEPDPSEPAFVGYSTGLLAYSTSINALWLDAYQLCKDTFGDSAIPATSDDIKDALSDNTFVLPTPSANTNTVGVFIYSSAIPGNAATGSGEWGAIYSYGVFGKLTSATFDQATDSKMACSK